MKTTKQINFICQWKHVKKKYPCTSVFDISTFLRELKQFTVSVAHFIPGLEQADRVGMA